MRRILISFAFSAGVACAIGGTASACVIDGKASAFANGVQAVIVAQGPTTANYSWWAHFAFPRPFHVGQRILLHENDLQVRPLLVPLADLRRTWQWRFGDGTTQIGDQVAHAYRQAGHFKVSVEAYYPGYGWLAFDAITVTVNR